MFIKKKLIKCHISNMLTRKEKRKNNAKKERSECGVRKRTHYFMRIMRNTLKIGLKYPSTSLSDHLFNALSVGEEYTLKNKDKCGPLKKIFNYYN